MSSDELAPTGFVPLRYTLPWPAGLVEFDEADDDGLSMIDRVGFTDFRHDEDADGRTRLRLGVALLDELSLSIPGLKGFSVVFGAPKRDPETGLAPPGARFTVAAAFGDPTSFGVQDVDVVLRMQQDLLRPMTRDGDGGWAVRTGPIGAPLPFEIRLDGVGLAVDTTGAVDVSFAGGAPGIEIDAFGIGDTGIVIEADEAVRLYVDDSTPPPPGRPQGWRGVHIPHAAVHLPHLEFPAVPSGLEVVDCTIGSGGFSGELDVAWDDGSASGSLLGADIELLSAKVRFVQNTPVEFGIEARLTLPFFDQPVDVELALGLDGAFTIGLSAEGGLAQVELEDVLRLRLDGLTASVEQGLATFSLSGAVTPLIEPVDWPTFTVTELSIDTAGHVKLAGGWLDLPDQLVLDFNGFTLEITRLGFGVTDDARHWIGFSGGLKLLDGLPAGASVDGLRISWDDAGNVEVSLDGVSVEFEVPGAVSFKGLVSYRDLPGGGQRFDGAIQLRLIALDLQIDAQLVVGRGVDPVTGDGYGFFAIYVGVELPVGIPLLSTGVGLYGMAGLFALNMEPNRRPDQNWYEDWYKKPTPGVANLAQKWENKLGSLAFGAGVTLGTQSDNGYTFAGRILLVIVFPGPVILLEGKANLLKARAELGGSAEPTFRSLAVLDFRSGSLMFGLDAFYRTGDDSELIEIRGGVETFFDFHDATAWYLNIGSDEPRDKRIRAGIFQIFQAEAWFMINAHRIYTGAWVGYSADERFGPLALAFEAWIEGTALLSFKPPHFHGSLWLHGKVALTVFGFGFGLGLDARLDADVFEPLILRLELEITLDLPWPLPDFQKTFTKQWGPRPDPPPLSTPLTELSLAHPKVTTTWRLPRDGPALLRPDVDDGEGFLAPVGAVAPLDPAAPPPTGLPVVPLDVRPQLTFGRPVQDAAGLGLNAGAAGAGDGWECIGNPVAGEGPVRIRTVLRSLELSRWRPAPGGGGTWETAARSPADPSRPTVPTMFGAWAPVPALPAGDPAAVGNTKLLVWARTPFDATRQAGQAWDEWFTAAFPSYPCPPPVPARRFCCDLRDLRVGDLVASPWRCPEHPEVTLSWPGRPRQVVLLDPPVGGLTKALCGPGTFLDAQGTPHPNPVTVTCSTPGVTAVTVQLPPDTVRPVRRCTDLTGLPPGGTANPLSLDGLRFEVPGAASITVVTLGGRVGLDCGRRLEAALDGTADEVELDVSAFGGVVTATGLDVRRRRVAVDRTPAGVNAATLRLRGNGIVRVVVDAPSDEAALHRICRTAPATTVTAGGPRTVIRVGGDGLVRVTGSDIGPVTIDNPGDRVCVTSVCFTLPPEAAEVARREELLRHLVSELSRWSDIGAVLHPDTVYRLAVGTRLEARSNDPLAGYTPIAGDGYGLDRDQVEYGYLATEGPPGLAAITGDDGGVLGTLTPYVGQTVPATVVPAGERPALPRPVYRGYDVAVRFDVDYAELMYRLAGRDLGLYVFDANNQPARDTRGRLLALTPDWTDAPHQLTRSERQWTTLIEGSACVPALTRTFAPDRQLAVGSGAVLGGDAVHEARLVPLLLHEDFRSGTGGWEALDQGQVGGPSVWTAARHPGLSGASATVTGSVVRLDGAPDLTGVVPRLDVLALTADTARPSGRWPVTAVDAAARTVTVDGAPAVTGTSAWQLAQLDGVAQTSGIRTAGDDPRDPVRPGTMLLRGAVTWSDLRLTVTLRSATDAAIGVVVRVAGPSRYYRFSMDRAAGRRRLVRVLDGVHTVLAEDRWTYGPHNDYAITVEAVGAALRVHQDGVAVFDVRDAALPTGRIGLYCHANTAALFSDVRVDDLSSSAPIVHRFSFTTSRFATFEHQLHSHNDEVWHSTAAAVAADAIAAAVPPATTPAEPEHRAYAELARAVPGAAAAVEAVEATRIALPTGLAGWLIRSPEPVDWTRVSLALHAANDATAPDPPAAVKLVGAAFGATSANDETVTVLAREAVDLDGHRIERRAMPGALAWRDAEPLLRATAGDAAAGVLLTEDFGPNALDRYTLVDDENASLYPSAWTVADGHIVQTGQYFVASTGPDKPGTMAILDAPVLSTARIAATLRSEDPDAIGLVFRYRDDRNFYRFSMALLDGYRRLTKKVGGVTQVLWEDAERLPRRGRSYRVVVETAGDRLVGWLDGELLFAVRDGDLTAGRVGFYAWKNMGAHFEALQVTAGSGDPVRWRPELGSLAGFTVVDAASVVSGPSAWAAAGGVVTQSTAVRVEDEVWEHVAAPVAYDVTAPAAGPVWVSADPVHANGFTAYRRLAGGWVPAPGIGVTAIAGTDRGLWALDAAGHTWVWMPQIPGALHWAGGSGVGTDIAAGGGALFLVSTVAVAGGGQVLVDRDSTGVWEPLEGQGAVTVAAGSDGAPWIVDDTAAVFRWDGAAWQPFPGSARAIAPDAEGGRHWMIGTDAAPGGHALLRWDGRAWRSTGRGAVAVAAAVSGGAWTVDDAGAVARFSGPSAARPGTHLVGGPAGADAWEDVEVAVRLGDLGTNDGGAVGLVFRYHDEDNFYRFSLDRGAGRRLVRMRDGVATVLWRDAVRESPGRMHALTVTAIGPRLHAVLDGEPLFTVSDAALPRGRVALYCREASQARFTGLTVFDRTRRVGPWVVRDLEPGQPSEWRLARGILTQEAPGSVTTAAVSDERGWSDHRLTVQLGSDDAGVVGAVFRYRGDDDHYRFELDSVADRRRLVRRTAGADTVLWERPGGFVAGETYLLTVDAAGTRLRGWLGASPLFDLTDGDHRVGAIGHLARTTPSARFARIELTAPPREALAMLRDRFAAGNRAAFTDVDVPGAVPAAWRLDGAELVQDASSGSGLAVGGSSAWTDAVLTARVRPGPGAVAGLVVRYTDPSSHYRWRVDLGAGEHRLESVSGGTTTVLWRAPANPVAWTAGRDLAIVAVGPTLRGFVDDVPIFEVDDAGLPAGRIGLDAVGRAGFSRVRVFDGSLAFRDWLVEPVEVPAGMDGDVVDGDATWTDYRISAHVRGAAAVGLVARYAGPQDHYRFSIDPSAGTALLERLWGGVPETLWAATRGTGPPAGVMVLDCVGPRLSGYLDGECLFTVTDDALPAGRFGIHRTGDPGATSTRLRSGRPAWTAHHTFGADPLPPGGSVRLHSGNRAADPAAGPDDRYVATFDEVGTAAFAPDGVDLRLRSPDGTLGHARRFRPSAAWSAVPDGDLRMLRAADGTGWFLGRAGGATPAAGDHELVLTFRRDNRAVDPDAPVLRRAGDASVEVVTLLLPGRPVGDA